MGDTFKLPEPVDYQIRLAGGRWTHCAKHIHEAAIKSGAAETRALHSADQMISFRAADNAALREIISTHARIALEQDARVKVLEDALQRYVNHDLLTGTRGKMNEIARAALEKT